jgi:hypothetical protein
MCYRRIGFRWHHLLRLAVQQEAMSAGGGGRQGQQPRGETAKAGRVTRDAPPPRSPGE